MTPRERAESSGFGRRVTDSAVGRSRVTDSTVAQARREKADEPLDPRQLGNEPVVRNYVIACLTAVVVLLFVLLYHGLGLGSLVPVLVGIMGVVTRWPAAPLLLTVSLAGLYYFEMLRYYGLVHTPRLENPSLSDLVLAATVLVYTASYYRLQGFYQEIIPREAAKPTRRRAGERLTPAEPAPRRSTAAAPPGEAARLPLVTAWAGAALLLWLLLPFVLNTLVFVVTWMLRGLLPPRRYPYLLGQLDLSPQVWRAATLIWLLGVGLLVLNGVLKYVSFRRLSGLEAQLFLQDVVWRESRREQTRITRWLAWARARRQRREESL